jgi:hypothetical protein
MIKFSAPQMVLILDVLFNTLPILVQEQSPNIQVKFSQNILINNTVVVSQNTKGESEHWFNIKTKKWEGFETFPSRKRKHDFIIGNIDCQKSTFCTKLPVLNNEIKKIYAVGDLADEIAGLVTDSCLRFPRQCVNVVYHVQDDGTLDRKRIKDENPIFSKIY